MVRLMEHASDAQKLETLKAAPYQTNEARTMVAALSLHGATAPSVRPGAMNGAAFDTYVREVPGPALHRMVLSSWIVCSPTSPQGLIVRAPQTWAS